MANMSVISGLFPASGTGRFWKRSAKTIRLVRQGCTNRPFYQIVVTERRRDNHRQPVIEQVGTYDPLPNKFNYQMVSLNYERIRHWLGEAHISRPAAEILGIAGFLPVYPKTYMRAWRNRKQQRERSKEENLENQATDPAN